MFYLFVAALHTLFKSYILINNDLTSKVNPLSVPASKGYRFSLTPGAHCLVLASHSSRFETPKNQSGDGNIAVTMERRWYSLLALNVVRVVMFGLGGLVALITVRTFDTSWKIFKVNSQSNMYYLWTPTVLVLGRFADRAFCLNVLTILTLHLFIYQVLLHSHKRLHTSTYYTRTERQIYRKQCICLSVRAWIQWYWVNLLILSNSVGTELHQYKCIS